MTSEIAKYLPAMIGVPSGITQTIKAWPFKPYINLGGQTSAAAVITYSQVDDLVTVTHTAHGFNADFNGSSIHSNGSEFLCDINYEDLKKLINKRI